MNTPLTGQEQEAGKPPVYFEERASKAEARGDWKEAARLWRAGAGASIGHNRRDRYYEAARLCELKLQRPLYEIAGEIEGDWRKISPYAKRYLVAMGALTTIEDPFGADNAKSIILYFLSNAAGWRGEVAKRIKAELKLIAGVK